MSSTQPTSFFNRPLPPHRRGRKEAPDGVSNDGPKGGLNGETNGDTNGVAPPNSAHTGSESVKGSTKVGSINRNNGVSELVDSSDIKNAIAELQRQVGNLSIALTEGLKRIQHDVSKHGQVPTDNADPTSDGDLMDYFRNEIFADQTEVNSRSPRDHSSKKHRNQSIDIEDEETPIPSVEEAYLERAVDKPNWQPLAVRMMEPLTPERLAAIPSVEEMETFSWELLRDNFGGVLYSPGLFYVPHSHGPCILPGRTYYAMDSEFEPYLPKWPGQNGAKLTAFFNDNMDDDAEEASYQQVPLFMAVNAHIIDPANAPKVDLDSISGRATPESQEPEPDVSIEYAYMGTYSQTRYSDQLDFERIRTSVPDKVKMYWAEELSDVGRPKWVTEKLMKHYFPKPEYTGKIPTGNDSESTLKKVKRDIQDYLDELHSWEKHARLQVNLMTTDTILQSFDREDCNSPPGLRLWWEYLHCDQWDVGFYNMLVKLKRRAQDGKK